MLESQAWLEGFSELMRLYINTPCVGQTSKDMVLQYGHSESRLTSRHHRRRSGVCLPPESDFLCIFFFNASLSRRPYLAQQTSPFQSAISLSIIHIIPIMETKAVTVGACPSRRSQKSNVSQVVSYH